MDKKKLIQAAFEARKMAYTPYSNFKVGAALLTKSGKIYQAGNIENASYTPTCCAERVAFFKAISEGEKDFQAIAIVGGQEATQEGDFEITAPCGVCRQVMVEFCDQEEFSVIMAKSEDEYIESKLEDILPYSFSKEDLDR